MSVMMTSVGGRTGAMIQTAAMTAAVVQVKGLAVTPVMDRGSTGF